MQRYCLFNLLLVTALIATFSACNNATEKKSASNEAKKDSPAIVAKSKEEPPAKRPGIINFTDTVSIKHTVLCIKDSAKTYDRIALKLGEIYGLKLGVFMKKNNIKMAGAPMAWYSTNKPPYFFEAGVAIDKKITKLPPKAYIKEIGTDSVLVAHYYGPYDLLSEAYEAANDYLKDHHRTLKSSPYEIYIGDPFDKNGHPIDPYKVQTDVVFPWK